MRDYLWNERHLKLKSPEARILSCCGHLDALGHRCRRAGATPLPRAWKSFSKAIRDVRTSDAPINERRLRCSLALRVGNLTFGAL